MLSESLGAGSGAGVIVTKTSGLAVSIAAGDIMVNPGKGPESGSPAALLSNPRTLAIKPVYDSGLAAYKFRSASDMSSNTVLSIVPAA